MFVVQVTPLIKGTRLEYLSYFSSIEYEIGSFLEVPVRGKRQNAIVTDIKPVSTTKTALKAATFSLRKLPQQPEPVVLPASLRATAEELTHHYPAAPGAILCQLIPADIKNGIRHYPRQDEVIHQEETTPQILTAKIEERFDIYQSMIRSTFAQKGSLLLVVPTPADANTAVRVLSKGISERIILLTSTQTKKQRDKAYQQLVDTTSAKLIICTPNFAYLERSDLLAIIIDQAASGLYTMRQRPYLDHRLALKLLAKHAGRSLVLGDTVHRTEDEVRRRNEEYLTYGEEAKRIAFTSPLSIITQKDKPQPKEPFKLFSDQLFTAVNRTLENKGHVFFYAARKGLAPVVACIDCGFIFRCPDSHTPYSLLRTQKNGEEKRWFISSTSGKRIPAADVCEQCGSWRLRERGIGIQSVYDEWRSLAPDSSVTMLDNTTATTPKQAATIADEFFSQKAGILIGTQVALPYLSRGVDLSAVISLDAARSIPTWRADESLFRLLLKLREITEKEVLVQSRLPADNLITHATRGAVERFYDEEISLREMLGYPPFQTFVLLTWTGSGEAVIELEKPIAEALSGLPVQFYNSPHSRKDNTERHGLIRITDSTTLYPELITKLRALPPYVKIEIDPEKIV